ncbi:MAG: GyrI-like domain-containing protein [Candidatus Methanosuratincola sp.]
MEPESKIVELEEKPAIAISMEVTTQEIGNKRVELFGELTAFLKSKGVQVTGPPFSLYHSWNDHKTVMVIGFPTATVLQGEGKIEPVFLPGGKVVTRFHVGIYGRMGVTYKRMMD